MSKIEIKNVNKIFLSKKGEKISALKDINLDIEAKKYHTLLGPSGCGKTTLLRMIAGLIEPTSGTIFSNGRDITHTPTEERNVGFVFQHFAIFPHLDVWHNTSYGPLVKGYAQEDVEKIVEKNLKMVGLNKRGDALPAELSGGMRQRLGLARALAASSSLLLLDEPLSALDAKIGEFLRYELKRIASRKKITAIHVTHNQEEAMTISDNIILMKKGKIVQTGTPEEIYNYPNSIFAANFIGRCNFFAGRKIDSNTVKVGDRVVRVKNKVPAEKVILGIRPEKIHLRKNINKDLLSGKIEFINFMGHLYEYRINVGGEIVKSYKRIKEGAIKENFKVGDMVELLFYPDDVFVFEEPEDLNYELRLE